MVPSGSLEPVPVNVHARSVQLDVNAAVGGVLVGDVGTVTLAEKVPLAPPLSVTVSVTR